MKYKQKAEKVINFLRRFEIINTQEIDYQEDELLFLNTTLDTLKNTNKVLRNLREKKLRDYVVSKFSGSKNSKSVRNISSVNTSDFKGEIRRKRSLDIVNKLNLTNRSNDDGKPKILESNFNTERISYKEKESCRNKEISLERFSVKKEDIIYENEMKKKKADYEKLRENFAGLQKRIEARKNASKKNREKIGFTLISGQSSLRNSSRKRSRILEQQTSEYYLGNNSLMSKLKKINNPIFQKIDSNKTFLNLKKKKLSPLVKRTQIGHQLNFKKMSSQKNLHVFKTNQKNNNDFMRKKSLGDIFKNTQNNEKSREFSNFKNVNLNSKNENNSGKCEKKKSPRKKFQIKIRDSPIKFGRITTTLRSESSFRSPKNVSIRKESVEKNELKVTNFDNIVNEKNNEKYYINYKNYINDRNSMEEKQRRLEELEKELEMIEKSLGVDRRELR